MLWPGSLLATACCVRVPFIEVPPREVVRDRNTGRREVRVVPAEGAMQADFFSQSVRHLAGIWQGQGA